MAVVLVAKRNFEFVVVPVVLKIPVVAVLLLLVLL